MRIALPLARTLQSTTARRGGGRVVVACAINNNAPSTTTTATTTPTTTTNMYSPTQMHRNNYTTHSQLPSEHQMVYEMCRKFADEELSPHAGKWDKEHSFPVEAVNKLVSLNE